MGLLSTGLKEDSQQLQHRAPGRMELVCQALFHCPVKEAVSATITSSQETTGTGLVTHRPQLVSTGEGPIQCSESIHAEFS